MPSVRASAYYCGYTYSSDTVPEQSFRQTFKDVVMRVKANPTPAKPDPALITEAVHVIQVGVHPNYPGKALVKVAFKLKGGGDVSLLTHFDNMRASVAEVVPAGVTIEFTVLEEGGKGNKMTSKQFDTMVTNANAGTASLMANNNSFTQCFGGGSGGSSNSSTALTCALPKLFTSFKLVYTLTTLVKHL